MKLTVATCQFPTSADIRANARHVMQQMTAARERGARVAHFPEACLSGYAGADFASYAGFDWALLDVHTRDILEHARRLELWVILGSTHRLSGANKPHNSLYIIDDSGRLVDRYDKRFCAGDASEQTGDLAHYSPGDHLSVFVIDGVRCGTQICHDNRYPELYREYKRRGVELMFHSYHAGNIPPERFRAMQEAVGAENWPFNAGTTYPGAIQPATMQAAAATNHIWISCPNTSAHESCYGSFFVRADGIVTGRLDAHATDILLSTVDTDTPLYDSTAAWRERVMCGILHSGTLVQDPRSEDRTRL